jgi:thiol-disulfide isomerase/thioredoxin
MKKHTILAMLLLLIASFSLAAQDKGIHFEHGLTWAQVKAKAKAENKFIFVDCFTSWCGPCKMMDTLVYPQQVAGDYMDEKFISLKVQIDKTPHDSEDFKLLYNDAADIAKTYHVVAYPTFLFFAPDGHIADRHTGAIFQPEKFIEKAAEAMDPATQYYTLLDNFNKNPAGNPEVIRKLAYLALYNYDKPASVTFSNAYLATQKDLYSPENLKFMYMFTENSTDKYFSNFLKQATKIDNVMGKGTAARKLQDIAMREDYFKNLTPGKQPNWKAKQAFLEQKYPGYGREFISRFHVEYDSDEKDWPKMAADMKMYGAKYLPDMELNVIDGYAQQVFENSPDKICLEMALEWSKYAKEKGYMTSEITYADLLYKTGHKDEAMSIIQEILKKAGIGSNMFEAMLDKMNKGIKTWENP